MKAKSSAVVNLLQDYALQNVSERQTAFREGLEFIRFEAKERRDMKSKYASAVLTALICGQAALVAAGVASVVVRHGERPSIAAPAQQAMNQSGTTATAGI